MHIAYTIQYIIYKIHVFVKLHQQRLNENKAWKQLASSKYSKNQIINTKRKTIQIYSHQQHDADDDDEKLREKPMHINQILKNAFKKVQLIAFEIFSQLQLYIMIMCIVLHIEIYMISVVNMSRQNITIKSIAIWI